MAKLVCTFAGHLPEQHPFLIAPHAFDSLNRTNVQAGAAVTDAIKEFAPPDTHDIMPKPHRASSQIWKYGVKLKEKSGSKKVFFGCFGSPVCRDNTKRGIYIAISEKSASNGTDHIKARHSAGE